MKTFLMTKPTFYGCNYVINPWMENNVGNIDTQLATQQWTTLYQTLAKYARVKVIDQPPALPDAVYTANCGAVLKYPTITISRFAYEQRQPETEFYQQWFLENDYHINDIFHNSSFEGAGDCLFDEYRGILWLGHGFRTSSDILKLINFEIADSEIIPLKLVNPKFYHLDTCFCPLPDGTIVYYHDAIDSDSQQLLQEVIPDHQLLKISEEDANFFACNAIVADKQTIITPLFRNELWYELQKRGYNVIRLDLSEFIKTGGAAKCLTFELPY